MVNLDTCRINRFDIDTYLHNWRAAGVLAPWLFPSRSDGPTTGLWRSLFIAARMLDAYSTDNEVWF